MEKPYAGYNMTNISDIAKNYSLYYYKFLLMLDFKQKNLLMNCKIIKPTPAKCIKDKRTLSITAPNCFPVSIFLCKFTRNIYTLWLRSRFFTVARLCTSP
ncbi:hypothetical protein RF11_08916 [Thelohanellus kitauei]|uniref:Uncharacterized protein n=1 Tax=Thelohanellus kitauei TaxID=669202 RepID=A0A0C2NK81_THEKT|nr:hypothetical protein RF11_08916 [Thelohanellus kitauei]